MACQNNSCLCSHIVISNNVTFEDEQLLINIPDGRYENGEKYCLVIDQPIPTDTTIAALAAITIGEDTTTTYPLVNPNCTNVLASGLQYRGRYATRVFTKIAEGVFKLLSPLTSSCSCCNSESYIPIPTTTLTNTTEGGAG